MSAYIENLMAARFVMKAELAHTKNYSLNIGMQVRSKILAETIADISVEIDLHRKAYEVERDQH